MPVITLFSLRFILKCVVCCLYLVNSTSFGTLLTLAPSSYTDSRTINILHSIVQFFYWMGISHIIGFICHYVFTFSCSITDMLKNVLLVLPSSTNEALWLWDHLSLTDYCIDNFSLQSSIIIGCNISCLYALFYSVQFFGSTA